MAPIAPLRFPVRSFALYLGGDAGDNGCHAQPGLLIKSRVGRDLLANWSLKSDQLLLAPLRREDRATAVFALDPIHEQLRLVPEHRAIPKRERRVSPHA